MATVLFMRCDLQIIEKPYLIIEANEGFVEELEEYTAFSRHWNKLKGSNIYTYQAQVYYITKEGALEEELIDVRGPQDQ